jgi:hypothetical protein
VQVIGEPVDHVWVLGQGDGRGADRLLRIDIDPTVQAPRARARLTGELDLVTAEDLWTSLGPLIGTTAPDDGGIVQLDLDLAGVPFCDVTGLNVLLRFARL